MKVGCNAHNEPLKVCHADLKKWDPESSDFKVICPVCNKGLLLVYRSQNTYQIIRHDRCTLCGQPIHYLDTFIGGEEVTEGP